MAQSTVDGKRGLFMPVIINLLLVLFAVPGGVLKHQQWCSHLGPKVAKRLWGFLQRPFYAFLTFFFGPERPL